MLLVNSNHIICFCHDTLEVLTNHLFKKTRTAFIYYICKLGHKSWNYWGVAEKRDPAVIQKKPSKLTSFLNISKRLSKSPSKYERYMAV